MSILDKEQVLFELLDEGRLVHVMIVQKPKHPELKLPEHLQNEKRVVLELSYHHFPVPMENFQMSTMGFEVTLSFKRRPFHCVVPWETLTAVATPGEDDSEQAAVCSWSLPEDFDEAPLPKPANHLKLVKMRWLLLALITGCASTLPTTTHNLLTPVEQAQLQLGIDAWKAAGLPWRDQCDDERSEIRIAYPIDAAERDRLCQGAVSSCFIYRDSGGFVLDPDVVPVFVIGDGITYGVWKHEAVHWLTFCSGLYRSKMEADRKRHGDKRLWRAEGVEGAMGPQR